MRHVAIVSFVGRLPTRARSAVRALVFAGIIWTLVVLLRELGPIMEIEARSTTIALPIDLPRSYFFSVPLILTSSLMLLTALFYFLEAVAGVVLDDHDARPERERRIMD